MFALTQVVLLATAFFAAQAIDGPYCTRSSFGDTSGREVPLKTMDIPVGTIDDDITIPRGCLQSETIIGSALYVCDIEMPPIVYVTGFYKAMVHRQSSAMDTATVQMWMYCF